LIPSQNEVSLLVQQKQHVVSDEIRIFKQKLKFGNTGSLIASQYLKASLVSSVTIVMNVII
jgi:hypothetical protein